MPRTKGAIDKTKRKSKLIRNTALATGAIGLTTGSVLYGKNVANRVKVAKGLERLEIDDAIKKAVNASILGRSRTADKLLSDSTKKAQEIAQRTNTSRAINIIKSDAKNIGTKLLGKILRRGK